MTAMSAERCHPDCGSIVATGDGTHAHGNVDGWCWHDDEPGTVPEVAEETCYSCGLSVIPVYDDGERYCPECESTDVSGAGEFERQRQHPDSSRSPVRRAIVAPPADPTVVERYLPSNYRVVATTDEGVLIEGSDEAGWGLDSYVIPRLASGLHWAKEIEGDF